MKLNLTLNINHKPKLCLDGSSKNFLCKISAYSTPILNCRVRIRVIFKTRVRFWVKELWIGVMGGMGSCLLWCGSISTVEGNGLKSFHPNISMFNNFD